MNDIERRLRDLGEKVQGDLGPAPVLGPKALRSARRRRIGTALTGILTVIALVSAGTYAAAMLSDDESIVAPATSPTPDARADAPRCGPPVDFKPTYLPEGWIEELQPDSGGGAAWRGIVGHYGSDAPTSTTEKAGGGFAELIAGDSPYPLSGGEKIRVLDEPARFGAIHEGFSVEFSQHGCDYTLLGWMDGQELKRFAEGLRLPGTYVAPVGEEDFAAIWPEDTATEAGRGCGQQSQISQSWRGNALTTAIQFADDVLGWNEPRIIQREVGHGGQSIEIRRSEADEGSEPEGPAVIVSLSEVATDCWSVVSVARLPDNKPTGLGISIRGRDVEIDFDNRGADSLSYEIGHGPHVLMSDPEPADGRITVLLTYPPDETGHFLLLFKDSEGRVFSAAGGPLPAGNFAAG